MSALQTALHSRIDRRLQPRIRKFGAGLEVLQLAAEAHAFDPFIMVDHFRMTQPTFPPHPHAGFSAVTYLFEDAQTGFRNRDSRGDDSLIEPGALHWTLAGAGVVHEEVPITPGRVAHGLQIFVNLPAAAKLMAPQSFHVTAQAMPTWTDGRGARARLAFGRWVAADGSMLQAPFDVPVDANLLDVSLEPGAALEAPIEPHHRVALHVVRGRIEIAGEVLEENAVALLTGGALLRANASAEAQFVLMYGTPLAEPIAQHGPFVMNTQAQILAAIERYQSGAMGTLAPMAQYSR